MTTARPLPDPDEYPGRDVVIYDGHCEFCGTQVRNLLAMDKWSSVVGFTRRLAFVSLHDARVKERFPDLSYDMLMEQMYVVTPAGTKFGGGDAVRYLSRRLPVLWPVMPILHLPGTASLWRRCYQWIARQRYRWNKDECENGACAVHLKPKQDR